RPGDSIVPICPFTPMANEKKILAKAWDNRYGCGLALELMKEVHGETLPNRLYAGATVQEEVGLRGAKASAHMIEPDIFYALDAAETNDIPYQYFISQGGTDAGSVHIANSGVPSAVIGVCSRYIHTSASIIHVDDYHAAKELLLKLVRTTDNTVIEQIRP